MELRDYQKDWIDRIYKSWDAGNRYIIAQMPTAAGKTISFASIAVEFASRNKRVLILTHREELLFQAIDKISTISTIDVGIIKAGIAFNFSKLIQVASIQSLTNRIGSLKNIDLVIIDECHHSKASSWKNILEAFPHALRLGVTATPIRLDGRSFRGLFTDLINGITVDRAIKDGHLSKYKLFASPIQMSVNNCSISAGDYKIADLAKANDSILLSGDLISSYHRHAGNRQGIVFAINIKHSQDICDRYNQAGVSAVHIDGKTPRFERSQILEKFREREIDVISNCNLFDEGVDLPSVGFVQIAKPTKSLSRYLQMLGRGLRSHPDKDYTVIIDHTNNYAIHGLPCTERSWSLDGVQIGLVELGKTADYQIVDILAEELEQPQKTILENSYIELIEITYPLSKYQLAQQKMIDTYKELKNLCRGQINSRSLIFNQLLTLFDYPNDGDDKIDDEVDLKIWEIFAIDQGFSLDWAYKTYAKFDRDRGIFNSQRKEDETFKTGCLIGNYGMTFVHNTNPKFNCDAKGTIRRKSQGMFQCGFCRSFYETEISNVKRNKCRQCGCMQKEWQSLTAFEIEQKYRLPEGCKQQRIFDYKTKRKLDIAKSKKV